MPPPFPGMDPYLEEPTLWAGVHQRLIVAIANALEPKLCPKYYDLGSYDLRINYRNPPLPPLTDAELRWVDQHLRTRGLR